VHVLINATSARLGGGITVLKNLLPALCAEDRGQHRYTVFAREEVRPRLDPGHARVAFETPRLEVPLLARAAFEQVGLPLEARRRKADVLLSPGGLSTFASPCPQVLLFQNFAPFDEDVVRRFSPGERLRLLALRELGIASARAASRVVFISDFAREQLLPVFGIPRSRTSRVHLGRDPAFSPEAKARAGALLRRHGIESPFLLSVGQFYPYKNLTQLLVAFARALPGLPENVPLVLAGAPHDPQVVEAVASAIARERLGGRVKLLGNLPYEDLPPLYAACALFLFPSACESFPNILVEGLSSGAPTLSSDAGPMPEVAGDGARYFDPFDPDAIAVELLRLYNDAAAQAALRARGMAKAATYSWEACARGLLEALETAAGAR
jgi:glycosyltransferase involved in cell wall biosynthesis